MVQVIVGTYQFPMGKVKYSPPPKPVIPDKYQFPMGKVKKNSI